MKQKLLAPLLLLLLFTAILQAEDTPKPTAPAIEQSSSSEGEDLDKILKEKNIGRASIMGRENYWSEFMNMLFVLGGIVVVLLIA